MIGSVPEATFALPVTPCTHEQLWRAGAAALAESGVPAPRRTARWLLEGILGASATQLIAYPEARVPERKVQAFTEAARRCQRHEPLQYVLEYAEFCGLKLRVTPDVLIPRPETELLVQESLLRIERIDCPYVLDVGTGSGCVALAIKHQRPDARVTACDISRAALQIAASNAEQLSLGLSFMQADMEQTTQAPACDGGFDLLVSNPPYVPAAELPTLAPGVRHFEPILALSAGIDPLRYYRALVAWGERLRSGGHLVVEVHSEYADEVCALLADAGMQDVDVRQDWAERPRIVGGCWPAVPNDYRC